MSEEINKIYAFVEKNGTITHIFSEAFETPQDYHVLIDDTNTDINGAEKYPVTDENGIFNYEYKDGKFQTRDKTQDIQRVEEQKLVFKYIASEKKSLQCLIDIVFKNIENSRNDSTKISVSGLFDYWEKGKYEVGDIRNYAGQTWECWTAHDNATYPDINPDNPQTWANFWRPLHGKSIETARPWTKPWAGTTDMYHAGEYMVYTDGNIYKCLSDTVYSPEEYAAHWQIQK